MKIRKNYVNIIALLAFSLGLQSSYAAQDASWWQRLAPSTETLTGMSWAAPGAIAAQRAFSESKLPSYSYFIPGAVGTALGTVARSDQGWSSAFLTSLLHQSPSFALAFALLAKEKWEKRNMSGAIEVASKANFEKFNKELPNLIKKYQENMHKLLTLFDKEFNQNIDLKYQDLIALHNNLMALRLKIIAINNHLLDQWQKGLLPVSWKTFEKQFNHILERTYLTPAQEIYANYIAYFMAQDDITKIFGEESYELLDKPFFKEKIKESIDRMPLKSIVKKLQDKGLSITGNADDNVKEFTQVLFEKNGILLKKIWELIKKHQNFSTQSDFTESLDDLVNRYAQKINNFVDAILSENPTRLDLKYSEITQLYSEISQLVSSDNQLLAPYDYIYADIIARTIKSYVVEPLDVASEKNKQHIIDLMTNHKETIKNIYNRLTLLATDIQRANQEVGLPVRMDALLKKVMKLVNKYNGFEFKPQSEEQMILIYQQKAKTKQLFEDYHKKLMALVDHIADASTDIEESYAEIKKSYALFQEALQVLQSYGVQAQEDVLGPYDYIYAAIVAQVIKSVVDQKLNPDDEDDHLRVVKLLQKFGDNISGLISRSPTLTIDITPVIEQRIQDPVRMTLLIKTIITLLNQELEK